MFNCTMAKLVEGKPAFAVLAFLPSITAGGTPPQRQVDTPRRQDH